MLSIELLGSFAVRVDGKTVLDSQKKLSELLAWLVVRAIKPMSQQTLLEELWPESSGPAVVAKTITRLRKMLGSEGCRIRLRCGQIYFDAVGTEIDLLTFENLIEVGTVEALESAAKLYKGPLLKEWNREAKTLWFMKRRQSISKSYENALVSVAKQCIEKEEWRWAAVYSKRCVDLNRDGNWAWEALIESLLEVGNYTEAIKFYDQYKIHMNLRNAKLSVSIHPGHRIEDKINRLALSNQKVAISNQSFLGSNAGEDVGASPKSKRAEAIYVKRPQDTQAEAALDEADGYTLRIKGARHTGKSAMLSRLLTRERAKGSMAIHTDWGRLSETELNSDKAFFRFLAVELQAQINQQRSTPTSSNFEEYYAISSENAGLAFEEFLKAEILLPENGHVVWAIDQADILFSYELREAVFRWMRVWHNARANDGNIFRSLSLILTYSTEAHLFISNLNESPFNVGTVVNLTDLARREAVELNRRHGGPLKCTEEIDGLWNLLGGHLHLWRISLEGLKFGLFTLPEMLESREVTDGLFRDHLRSLYLAIHSDSDLKQLVMSVLEGKRGGDLIAADRLLSSGVLTGVYPHKLKFRCELYREYFQRTLQGD